MKLILTLSVKWVVWRAKSVINTFVFDGNLQIHALENREWCFSFIA